MLARLADSYYWMFRYLERIENYARFMDVNFQLTLEFNDVAGQQWEPQVAVSGDRELFDRLYDECSRENVLYFLSFHPENPNSICASVMNMLENAKFARPEISVEVWEQMNSLKQVVMCGRESEVHKCSNPSGFFANVRACCYMIYGAIEATFNRSESYHFATMGKYAERADKTARVLDVKYHILLPEFKGIGSSFDLLHWAALLKSVSGYEIYLRKYGQITPSQIVDFIIFDPEFPRSMRFAIRELEHAALALSGNGDGYFNEVERSIHLLREKLDTITADEILVSGLHEFLVRFIREMGIISDAITSYYFVNKRYLNVSHIRPFEEKDRLLHREQSQTQSMA